MVVDRPDDLDAVLVTRFLDHSISYRALFANPRGGAPDRPAARRAGRAAGPAAPGRLHLGRLLAVEHAVPARRRRAGRVPGRRRDGRAAPALSDGQARSTTSSCAFERVGGELFDLQAGGLLPTDVDPIEVAEEIPRRYEALWTELTREEIMQPREQRYRIAERLRRLNELGFDVDEVELIDAGDGGSRLRHADPGRRARPPPAPAVHPDRTGRPGEPGPPAAQRHRQLPRPSSSERRPAGARGGRGQPVAQRGVRPGGRRDPGRAARPARRRRRSSTRSSSTAGSCPRRAGRDIGTTAARDDYFARVLPVVPDLTVGSGMRGIIGP